MAYPAYMARPKTYAVLNIKTVDPLLIKLLGLCTPHGTEDHIKDIIKPIVLKQKATYTEVAGNVVVVVNPARKVIETMFSSHMDIVGSNHKDILAEGKVEKIQIMMDKHSDFIWGAKVIIDADTGKTIKYIESTLGADDKVGVYLMLKMIMRNIPGMYIFHVGEECGCIGSRALLKDHQDLLSPIKRAIALDRAGYQDVIAFQGDRTASKIFTDALAKELNSTGHIPPKALYNGDVRGVYTDTAVYKGVIPECTNLSVGYFNQHGTSERLDHIWLKCCLEPALMKVDWDNLPIDRDPKAVTTYTYPHNNYKNSWWGNNEDNEYAGSGYGSGYVSKKKWHEVDDKTNVAEIPYWYPTMGWPPGCNTVVPVKKAIMSYLSQSTVTSYAKEQISELLAKCLAEVLILKELDQVQKKIIAELTPTPKEEPKVDVKVTPAEQLSEDMKKIEDVTYEEEDCLQKKNLLTGIVLAVDRVEKMKVKYKGVDPVVFRGYAMSSQAFLGEHENTKTFTAKENRKVNKIFVDMVIMFSKLDLDDIDEVVETLVDDLWAYVTFHKNENEFADMTGAWNKSWDKHRKRA